MLKNGQKYEIEQYLKRKLLNSLCRSKPSLIIKALKAIHEKEVSAEDIQYFQSIPSAYVASTENVWDSIKRIRDIFYLPYPNHLPQKGDASATEEPEKYPDGIKDGMVYYWENGVGSRVLTMPSHYYYFYVFFSNKAAAPFTKEEITDYFTQLIQDNIDKYNEQLKCQLKSYSNKKELASNEHQFWMSIDKCADRHYLFMVSFRKVLPTSVITAIEQLCKNYPEATLPEFKKSVAHDISFGESFSYYCELEFFENEHDFQLFFQVIVDYLLAIEKNSVEKAVLVNHLDELRTHAGLPQPGTVLEKRKLDLYQAIYFAKSELPIPVGQDWHHDKLRYLIPSLKSGGACCGFSHIASNASLVGKRAESDARSALIYYGVPNKAGKITTVDDLKRLITDFNLQDDIKYPEKQQISLNSNGDHKDNDPISELLEALGLAEMFSNSDDEPPSEKFITTRSAQSMSATALAVHFPISKEELGEQIKLAAAIRSALYVKYKKNNVGMKQSEIEAKIATFDKEYCHVATLAQLEAYFSTCAVYQSPSNYLEKVYQNDDRVDNIAAPISLDRDTGTTGVVELCDLRQVYTSQELKKYFESLESQIDLYLSEHKFDDSAKTDFPMTFILLARQHEIMVGYNRKTKKWIIQDINAQPSYEVSTEEVALHVIERLVGPCGVTNNMRTPNLRFSIGYDEKNSRWILYHAQLNENALAIEKNAFEKLQTLSNIVDVKNMLLHIISHVYTSHATEADMRVLLNHWHASPGFVVAHQLTADKCNYRDELFIKDDSFGKYALRYSAWKGDIARVRELLDYGVREDLAMHMAVKGGHEEIVNLLIHGGCNLLVGDMHHNAFTALDFAVACNKYKMAEILITVGGLALINRINDVGTPLMIAASMGNTAMAKLLVEAGADLSIKMGVDQTAYAFAKSKQDSPPELLQLLDPNKTGRSQQLHYHGLFSSLDRLGTCAIGVKPNKNDCLPSPSGGGVVAQIAFYLSPCGRGRRRRRRVRGAFTQAVHYR